MTNKNILKLSCVFFFLLLIKAEAQDTFSIVAIDSLTGEVGSAGASCVDMFTVPFPTDFLGDLIPGTGAINTQAAYIQQNQTNARTRMLAGDTPAQIIAWLVANDAQSLPTTRQYGIAAFVNGSPQTDAYTGPNCTNYKNHILGPYYSIQGNILIGQNVLDSMQSRFLNEPGDLACKLMAALQGAKIPGADARCLPDGTSSLFAFVKVSLPTDPYGSPSFLVSVKTHDNSGIEPIDSLQVMFDAVHNCTSSGIPSNMNAADEVLFYPNPSANSITVKFANGYPFIRDCIVLNTQGKKYYSAKIQSGHIIDMKTWPAGLYIVEMSDGVKTTTHKILRP